MCSQTVRHLDIAVSDPELHEPVGRPVEETSTETQLVTKNLGPDLQKVSSLSQISPEILLKSGILVSAETLLKLRFMKGILAETKISDMF